MPLMMVTNGCIVIFYQQEGNINTMRMEEVKENLRRAQSLLEERLIERDKRIQNAIHQTEHKKVLLSVLRVNTSFTILDI